MPRTVFLLLLLLAPAWGLHDGDPPPFPPPGQLIDIGGWHLHRVPQVTLSTHQVSKRIYRLAFATEGQDRS
jgi:hypothetical protein